jgi:hypothetical protein
MRVNELATRTFQDASDEMKAQMRASVEKLMSPQQFHQIRQQQKDPALYYCQQMATKQLLHAQQRARMAQQQQRQQQQQQGMGPNPNVSQPAMQMQLQQLQQQQQQLQQQKQQMAMNAGMMNGLGVQGGGLPAGQVFTNISENIVNEQKAGFLAEQAGQMVVPVSNGAGRNATPQPMGSIGGQNMSSGGQLGAAQQSRPGPVRPPQMGQPFNLSQAKMEQAAAQSAAQSKAQATARQMQGQPGGLGGPAPASQSPAMNTLTAPMNQPPVAANGQGNPAMGQMLDKRFNHQANTRPISMSGNININGPLYHQFMNAVPPQQRQTFMSMPPERLREIITKWEQSNGMNRPGQAMNQAQMGQMNNNHFAGVGAGGAGVGLPQQQQQGNPNMVTPGVQQAMMQQAGLAARAQMASNPRNLPPAVAVMNSMQIPDTVRHQLLQGRLPMEIQKWGDLIDKWLPHQNLPPQVRQSLEATRNAQFRDWVATRQAAQAAAASGQLPMGAQQQQQQQLQRQQAGGPAQPSQLPMGKIPPNFFPPHILQVTPQELQNFRQQPALAHLSNEDLSTQVLQLKQRTYVRNFQMAQEQQQQQRQQQMHQLQQAGLANMPGTLHQQNSNPVVPQPEMMMKAPPATAAQPPAPAPPQAQKPMTANAEPAATGAKNNNNAARALQNRAAPPNPSPAPAPKNLKRPLSEVNDAPEVPTANAANNQRPNTQPATRPVGTGPTAPTQEQINSMGPEQRQRYRQFLFVKMLQETQQEVVKEMPASFPDIAMSAEEKQAMGPSIIDVFIKLEKTRAALIRFPWGTPEGKERVRQFFKHVSQSISPSLHRLLCANVSPSDIVLASSL